MQQIIEKILITETEISKIITKVAAEINRQYADNNKLTMLYILDGAKYFAQNLAKQLQLLGTKIELHPIRASSYCGETKACQDVILDLMDTEKKLLKKHILIVDDIFDTGTTLTKVVAKISQQQPKSVKTCSLLERSGVEGREIKLDFYGYQIKSDDFLVGFGLDYQNQLRELPYIATIKKDYCGQTE